MSAADPFTAALSPCYGDALRYTRALCAGWSPSEAEDVLQDALIRALRGFGGLKDRERFRPWLFQIITRTFHSHTRRSFWKRFVPLSAPEPGTDRLPDVFHRPEWSDERLQLLRALGTLGAKERAAILLFEIGGFSIEEIAALQGERSQSAVKSRLSRARQRLREALGAPPAGPTRKTNHPSNATGDLDHETIRAIAAGL